MKKQCERIIMQPEEAKTLVFNHWHYLNKLARKRFPQDSQLAEQAIDYMLDKLEKNNWQRVCSYQGGGFTAFITVVANRLFIDFARKVGEIPYVPRWIAQQGELWKKIYFMLTVKSLSKYEIAETLVNSVQATNYSREDIEDIIQQISQKERIKPKNTNVSINNEYENVESDLSTTTTPVDELEQVQNSSHLDMLFLAIQALQNNVETDDVSISPKMKAWVMKLKQHMQLSAEEYVFLTMVYRDGLKVVEAGRRLQLNANQSSGRHRRLLARLQHAFTNAGLESELRLLLD